MTDEPTPANQIPKGCVVTNPTRPHDVELALMEQERREREQREQEQQ